VRYRYRCLDEAKNIVIRMWTPDTWRFPMCAVCGHLIQKPPHIHHLFVSTRYAPSRYDVRNLVPVHGPLESDCHQERAHAGETEAMSMRLYMILGQGNWLDGVWIVGMAAIEWNYTFDVFIARKDTHFEQSTTEVPGKTAPSSMGPRNPSHDAGDDACRRSARLAVADQVLVHLDPGHSD